MYRVSRPAALLLVELFGDLLLDLDRDPFSDLTVLEQRLACLGDLSRLQYRVRDEASLARSSSSRFNGFSSRVSRISASNSALRVLWYQTSR